MAAARPSWLRRCASALRLPTATWRGSVTGRLGGFGPRTSLADHAGGAAQSGVCFTNSSYTLTRARAQARARLACASRRSTQRSASARALSAEAPNTAEPRFLVPAAGQWARALGNGNHSREREQVRLPKRLPARARRRRRSRAGVARARALCSRFWRFTKKLYLALSRCFRVDEGRIAQLVAASGCYTNSDD